MVIKEETTKYWLPKDITNEEITRLLARATGKDVVFEPDNKKMPNGSGKFRLEGTTTIAERLDWIRVVVCNKENPHSAKIARRVMKKIALPVKLQWTDQDSRMYARSHANLFDGKVSVIIFRADSGFNASINISGIKVDLEICDRPTIKEMQLYAEENLPGIIKKLRRFVEEHLHIETKRKL